MQIEYINRLVPGVQNYIDAEKQKVRELFIYLFILKYIT